MKKLTLKLIETGEKPKVGDLIVMGEVLMLIKNELGLEVVENRKEKAFLPYGLSCEENKFEPALYYSTVYGLDKESLVDYDKEMVRIVSEYHNGQFPPYLKKVELLPEHFNYQQLVELGLKDGDLMSVEYWEGRNVRTLPVLDSSGKAIISRFTPDLPKVADKQKTYTEEEVIRLMGEYGEYILSNCYKESSAIIENAREWFNSND